jgi:hypothetical protein
VNSPKCLSLRQPWATLVALGLKRYETRAWDTDYRGPLFIHASAKFQNCDIALCFEEPFHSVLTAAGIKRLDELPLGAIICATAIEDTFATVLIAGCISEQERAFGNYEPRRHAFRLSPPIATPIVKCGGMLSLWTPDQKTLDALGFPKAPATAPLFESEVRV